MCLYIQILYENYKYFQILLPSIRWYALEVIKHKCMVEIHRNHFLLTRLIDKIVEFETSSTNIYKSVLINIIIMNNNN